MVERHAKGVDCKQKHVVEVTDRKQVTCPRCKILLTNPEIAKAFEEQAFMEKLELNQRMRRIAQERLESIESKVKVDFYTGQRAFRIICPQCGRDMHRRQNKKNGRHFWGCTGYPRCKATRNDSSVQNEINQSST